MLAPAAPLHRGACVCISQVPHEWPGVQRPNGLWTTFSACDTTSLFIIATYTVKTRAGARARHRHASVSDLTSMAMVDALAPSVQRAVDYILSHVDSRGLFVENPGAPEVSSLLLLLLLYLLSAVLNTALLLLLPLPPYGLDVQPWLAERRSLRCRRRTGRTPVCLGLTASDVRLSTLWPCCCPMHKHCAPCAALATSWAMRR